MQEKTLLYTSMVEQAQAIRESNDCAVKAITALSGLAYSDVWYTMKKFGRPDCSGTPWEVIWRTCDKFGLDLIKMEKINPNTGFKYTPKTIAERCIVGSYLVHVRKHVFAVIDGQIHDWSVGREFRILRFWRVEKRGV